MVSGVVTVLMMLAAQPSLADGAERLPAWHDNYGSAMQEAKRTGKMLLVYFHKDKLSEQDDKLLKKLNNDPKLRPLVRQHVLVRIPVTQRAVVDGKKIQLIKHTAFTELQHQPGVALIDLVDPKRKYHGHVVSIYPLSLHGALTTRALAILLDLPIGSLTQRTIILAVRMHPERPASTNGVFLASLARESESHSRYQAEIMNQGHHNWDSRFQRISARLPSGLLAREVVAESWPGQGLIAAAVDCVHSWRQSSGHWGAVRGRHRFFGYDMKRGRNGIWYATGIFSAR